MKKRYSYKKALIFFLALNLLTVFNLTNFNNNVQTKAFELSDKIYDEKTKEQIEAYNFEFNIAEFDAIDFVKMARVKAYNVEDNIEKSVKLKNIIQKKVGKQEMIFGTDLGTEITKYVTIIEEKKVEENKIISETKISEYNQINNVVEEPEFVTDVFQDAHFEVRIKKVEGDLHINFINENGITTSSEIYKAIDFKKDGRVLVYDKGRIKERGSIELIHEINGNYSKPVLKKVELTKIVDAVKEGPEILNLNTSIADKEIRGKLKYNSGFIMVKFFDENSKFIKDVQLTKYDEQISKDGTFVIKNRKNDVVVGGKIEIEHYMNGYKTPLVVNIVPEQNKFVRTFVKDPEFLDDISVGQDFKVKVESIEGNLYVKFLDENGNITGSTYYEAETEFNYDGTVTIYDLGRIKPRGSIEIYHEIDGIVSNVIKKNVELSAFEKSLLTAPEINNSDEILKKNEISGKVNLNLGTININIYDKFGNILKNINIQKNEINTDGTFNYKIEDNILKNISKIEVSQIVNNIKSPSTNREFIVNEVLPVSKEIEENKIDLLRNSRLLTNELIEDGINSIAINDFTDSKIKSIEEEPLTIKTIEYSRRNSNLLLGNENINLVDKEKYQDSKVEEGESKNYNNISIFENNDENSNYLSLLLSLFSLFIFLILIARRKKKDEVEV